MLRKILDYIDLRDEVESKEYIQDQIEQGVNFRGTNLWILGFAIVVASVGLNTNSTAVIIGAMLISPLMGPLNAIGYSISTYDFNLFKRAFSNLGFAIITSLIASTLYFAITPVSTAHSELLSRIHPTIYDVIIAFFGGLSGIIALSSKRKGNVLPGVAIATALMPPLCTAGYGLGTGQYNFFFGAIYLFVINAVFIALANMVAVKYLKIPISNQIQETHRRRTNIIVYSVMFATIIPSIYFGYKLVEDERFKEKSESYCQAVKQIDDKFLLEHQVDLNSKSIQLIYGGDELSLKEKQRILNEAKVFGIDSSAIVIRQGITFKNNALVEDEFSLLQNQNAQLSLNLQRVISEKDSIISLTNIGEELYAELHVLYPEVKEVTVTQGRTFGDTTVNSVKHFIALINYSGNLTEAHKKQIQHWLKLRIKAKQPRVLFLEKN